MALRLYNTLSRQIEDFIPLRADQVGVYSCGPTVYNYAHIGNLRAYVFADILNRALRLEGFSVKHVINITDVGHLTGDQDDGEDKIEKEAKLEHKTAGEIIDFYQAAFFADLDRLNIDRSHYFFPRASEHIAEQITLIRRLKESGFTYKTGDGIYFETAKFPVYAELAQLDLAGQQAGGRVEINPEKRQPTDFALWKFSRPGEHREQEWPSPWGVGFPGWHLECSAMSMKYLGEHFDIHTGGIDHLPIHHTNERAQSEAATGQPFANYWLHVNFLNLGGGKMAKSEGNIIRLSTLAEKGIFPLAYRYFLLSASYHSSLTFSWETLAGAQSAYERLSGAVARLKLEVQSLLEVKPPKPQKEALNKFRIGIEDDLNTPKALAVLEEVLKSTDLAASVKLATILKFDEILGLDLANWKDKGLEGPVPDEVKKLAEERQAARATNNYILADQLRDKIEALGWQVKDAPDGYAIVKK